jgi:hypothetical protein
MGFVGTSYARAAQARKKSTLDGKDFEYLTILSREWMQTRGTVFPKDRRRLLPTWGDLDVPKVEKPKTLT